MKLAIFDLDGVLVDTSKIHTAAFRQAVLRVVHEEAAAEPMLDAADGIRTVDKLEVLRTKYGLSDDQIRRIDQLKQELTLQGFESLERNEEAIKVMRQLFKSYIAVASNSRRQYVDLILEKIGVKPYVDFVICGNEVKNPKPDPEIFLTVMQRFGVSPESTVIFEDSPSGLKAARKTGAHVVQVDPHTLITKANIAS